MRQEKEDREAIEGEYREAEGSGSGF